MKIITSIREFLWPLLKGEPDIEEKHIEEKEFKIQNADNIKTAYDLSLKYYENEEKRTSTVEGKSIVFIGTVGFLITILIAVVKDISGKGGTDICLNMILLTAIMIYLCRVAWFAIKALGVSKYHKIGYQDFLSSDVDYQKNLIIKLIDYTRNNFKSTNLKVDYMVMAQAYFKRVIVAVGLYVIFLLMETIYVNFSENISEYYILLCEYINIFKENDIVLIVLNIFIAILTCLMLLAAFSPQISGKLLNQIHNGSRLKEKLQNADDRVFIRALALWLLFTQLLQMAISLNISRAITLILEIITAGGYVNLLWVMGKKKEDFLSLCIIIAGVLFAILIGFLGIWNGNAWMFLMFNVSILLVSLIFMIRGIEFYKANYLKVLGMIAIWFFVCKSLLEFSYIYSNDNIKEIVSLKNILDGFVQAVIVGGAITYISMKKEK